MSNNKTKLTTRERETLRLVATGADNAGIAALMSITESTVENHLSTLYVKLGIVDGNRRVKAVLRYITKSVPSVEWLEGQIRVWEEQYGRQPGDGLAQHLRNGWAQR
jgi:DNA-binding CsgD family transcriptional regulator